MFKKLRLAMALTGALAMGTAASVVAQEVKDVRMWTFLNVQGTSPREVALAQIIKDFEAQNPDVRITVETQVFDQMTPKFLAAHSAGNAPDVIWALTDFLGDAIGSGSLADLRPEFMSDWTDEQVADRAGPYWDLCEINGKHYCLFTSRYYIAIVYRKDLLDEAGIDVTSLTSWEAFRAAAEKLTVKDGSGNVVRYGFGQGFSEKQADPPLMVPMMLAMQGALFDENGRAQFATPEAVEAVNYVVDLIKSGFMPEQSINWTVDDVYEQFAADRLAMIQGASVRVSTLQAKVGADNVGLMLYPGSTREAPHSPAVMTGWAVGVWSGSAVKSEAARFVDYMLGEESDPLWVTVGGQSPGLQSTAEKASEFFSVPANDYLTVAAEGSAKYGWLAPLDYSIGGFREILSKVIQNVVVNGVNPLAALQDAEAEFNERNNR
jgi:multiple sugar transport system substrate-binding protein